jgi:hypothetical protein
MEATFYVYGHYIPNNEEPFYIGMGIKKRAYDRIKRSTWWKRYVEKHGLLIKILYENLSKEQAVDLEKELIKKYGRINIGTGILINLTDGGEGTIGVIRSVETRQKLSKINLGKTHTEETKQKLSKINLGKTHTEETRNKISQSMKGKTHSEETRKKLKEIGKKRQVTEEQRIKHKDAMRRWAEKRREQN